MITVFEIFKKKIFLKIIFLWNKFTLELKLYNFEIFILFITRARNFAGFFFEENPGLPGHLPVELPGFKNKCLTYVYL